MNRKRECAHEPSQVNRYTAVCRQCGAALKLVVPVTIRDHETMTTQDFYAAWNEQNRLYGTWEPA